MKLYSKNEHYKLYQGSMLDMLEVIEPNSIDSIITDPPYGLTSITKRFGKENSAECKYGKDGSFQRLSKGFMGKEWDGSGIEYNIETWKKCYEVLKPGGYLLAFGGSRTFHRIACAIEDAGFEIRDTIMWIYGVGFPKSMDISKQIDKKGGNDYSKQFAKDLKQARESRNLTMKYCDDKYCGGTTNWSWYEGRPKGMRVPDYDTYLRIVKDFPELEKYKKLIKEAEREVIGSAITNKTVYQNIGGKNISGEVDITIPETDLAKQWQGWGTALKPSFEPIIVARKPFKGSLVDNVIEWGVGGINIDECRVGNEELHNSYAGNKNSGFTNADERDEKGKGMFSGNKKGETVVSGRFPANTILTYDETDYDEVCGGFPDTKSGSKMSFGSVRKKQPDNCYKLGFTQKEFNDGQKAPDNYGDSGSASRYFYCAKASKRDRDEGLDEFEETKCSMMASNDNIDKNGNFTGMLAGRKTKKRNTHPTVKPTSLMQYLVRLVSPKGATILDCFNGSGSTGKAVMYENKERDANYKYIGIELTEEYLPIAKARIEYVCNSGISFDKKETQEEIIKGQTNIFEFIGDDKE